jgi:hypothetical protein
MYISNLITYIFNNGKQKFRVTDVIKMLKKSTGRGQVIR